MFAYSKIKVSAPGSLMLMGEHAVLFGEPALACAVDAKLVVTLQPRQDRLVRIDSALGQYRGSLDALEPMAELAFVLAVIERYQMHLSHGFDLHILSGFSHTVGLGSSAAVTAATVAALAAYSGQSTEPEALFPLALAAVHQVQNGRGSGTDLAASLYGGVIGYEMSPAEVRPLPGLPSIALYYSGYKMKTPAVLALVEQKASRQPELYAGLYRLMGQTCRAAEQAVRDQDWVSLGELMNIYQGLMDALGVCDATLAEMIHRLRAEPGCRGAKISGSGLGDCVLALGHLDAELPWEAIPVTVSATGVEISYETN
ncbi:mevalonate kinase [Marinobacterium sediminicola]|uniref:Mevalonate kinase n=1 Tax=Marinobacterium sediminicola TaxID=518898 RepID=A0ABY1RXZ4_9GAMM|nr:mevalonate kinase [Marinobacterium sediminicola]ULG68584.1 mevalonate kinase [Marinobacterium sediminicola]SMR73102.1 mevalonate kinase [Marinobacterium sediminicola]